MEYDHQDFKWTKLDILGKAKFRKYRPLAQMTQIVICTWKCYNHNGGSWSLFFSELPSIFWTWKLSTGRALQWTPLLEWIPATIIFNPQKYSLVLKYFRMMASVNCYYCLAKNQLCKVLSKVLLIQQSFKACAQLHKTLENKTLSNLFPLYFKRSSPVVAGCYFGNRFKQD